VIEGLDSVRSRIIELQRLTTSTPSGDLAVLGDLPATSSSFADVLAQVGSPTATSRQRSQGGGTGALGQRVVSIAKQYLGIPYRWGGTNPKTGLDCSGLTQLVFRQVGVNLPRVSRDQAKVGREISSLKDAQPGDLVFFHSPVSHVGIYIGDGKMLEAPHTGADVRIRTITETPTHIRRVLPEGTAATGATGAKAASSGLTSTSSGKAAAGPYGSLFVAAGRRYRVDPALLSAVAKAESSYNATSVSSAGAKGLMQLMPATARELGVDPLNPGQAVDGAARLLSGYLNAYGNRVDLALAAYNAGPGAVSKYGGVPPYPETRNYVQRVTRYWEALR